jgi:membrane protease YdiL (CAAX protease family)
MKNNIQETALSEQRVASPAASSRGMISLGLGFLVVYSLVLLYARRLPFLARIPGQWNWSGKIMSIAFSCLVLACSPWLRQNVGLRWRQSRGSAGWSAGCLLACLAIGVSGGFAVAPRAFSWESLLFQFFIPGIDEELAFRGIALALLERGFGQSPVSCRMRFGWAALITSLFFGLGHAVSFGHGQFGFSLAPFFMTTAFASAAALIRTRSGSLLWPMLCHSAWDGTFYLVSMMR